MRVERRSPSWVYWWVHQIEEPGIFAEILQRQSQPSMRSGRGSSNYAAVPMQVGFPGAAAGAAALPHTRLQAETRSGKIRNMLIDAGRDLLPWDPAAAVALPPGVTADLEQQVRTEGGEPQGRQAMLALIGNTRREEAQELLCQQAEALARNTPSCGCFKWLRR
eukprot:s1054_g4.t3